MNISFVNLPCDICWNDGVEQMFSEELEALLGYRPDMDEIRVRDRSSNVHVLVFGNEPALPLNTRTAVAKQIFLFLKFHGILEGSDVYFYDYGDAEQFKDRFFEPSDLKII